MVPESEKFKLALEVVCPSTGRRYRLFPPNQTIDDTREAWYSLFNNLPLSIARAV